MTDEQLLSRMSPGEVLDSLWAAVSAARTQRLVEDPSLPKSKEFQLLLGNFDIRARKTDMIERGDLEQKQIDWIKKVRELSNAVVNERLHQWGKWGYQRHTGPEWLAILAEEFGEAAKGSVELFLGKPGDPTLRSELRAELIQVAAVAIAFAQAIDTGEA